MSRKPPGIPPSRRPSPSPGPVPRDVKIGVKPPNQLGVLIVNGGDKTIIAPDEARALASTEDDPAIASKLREFADQVPDLVEQLNAKHGVGHASVVGPALTGPDALRQWVLAHRLTFQAGYRAALAAGYPEDIIVFAMPRTESLDDPPAGFDLQPRSNRGYFTRAVPSLRGKFDKPSQSGTFYVLASRGSGRFHGSFVGGMFIPGEGDELPAVTILPERTQMD